MLAIYRTLLYLYPSAYRCDFGDEMMDVLSEVQAASREQSFLACVSSEAREIGGLLNGALREHLRGRAGSCDLFSPRRFAMRSEFRFPKATVGLMLVILAAVMFTIEKAKAISASIPHTNPSIGHIQPAQMAIVPSLLVAMIGAIVVGVLGWAVLYALHRSGVQQLSEMNPSVSQRVDK